ncbi:threonine aldolase [Streptomyces sp. SID8014]|uniref:threonine aldolase family protein n=1 Tax=Streptomyces sp. SID8014 TaxID=2706097 RepID=UPI0013BB1FDE|nr:beta-eliminating lyase-related protein [Streptomyces sp. SID8014]NEC13345.1 threonine aldolase [Streptomyces sp. SID8014]
MNENERDRQTVTDPAEPTADAARPPEERPRGEGPGGDDPHTRRAAALRSAERVLARHSTDATLQERLAALSTQAASVHDLAEPVDVYGNGVVDALEDRVADVLGTEAAAFFPTGTMAQQVALRCWAGRSGNHTVALHPLSHPEVHEGGALGAVSGLRTVHPTRERRLPTAAEVAEFPEPFGTLMLELPLRDAGFVLPDWAELTEVVAAARERDAVVHLDGARLWECAAHFGRALPEIVSLADSVYVSFYKSLEGIGGAALAGPADLVDEARVWRHRYGGQLFQQFPTALAALHGLETVLPLLPSYVAKAREVAEAIGEGFAAAGAPWFRVHPRPVHTHQFQVWLPYEAQVLDAAVTELAEETGTALFRRWMPGDAPGVSVAEVTVAGPGLAWTPTEVAEAAETFARRVAAAG